MLAQLFFAAVALLVPYLYRTIRFKRLKQFARFPQLPPSAVLGHLGTVDEFIKRSPPGAHPDVAFADMHEALGRPPVMFVDLRPAASPMLIVASYKVAEQVARSSDRFPYSPPKVREIWEHMVHLAGPTSIASSKGEEWKALRKRFNPGFAPQHLLSLLPAIVHKASIFVDRLSDLSKSGDEFSLQRLATDLTFDVIGDLALDTDMGSQTAHPAKITRNFQTLIRTYTDEQIDLPWWFTPRLEWRRKKLALQVRASLKAIVQESHAKQNVGTNRPRSILSMSLEGVDTLSPELLDTTCDQLSTFLFAGHDTTSTTIAWMLYEVSRTPRVLRAVRAELDEIFGPDPSPAAVASRLLAPGGEELVNRMAYTSAVIRETLRLWPPGATSRMTKPGEGLTATVTNSDGEACEMNLDGMMIYHVPYIAQRDPTVFGETANTFVPERWLQKGTEDGGIPAAAFRAFERGPRNCIGQELATIEARVVMALVTRHFDFSKVGTGAAILDSATGQAELDAHGQYKVAEKMYNTHTTETTNEIMRRDPTGGQGHFHSFHEAIRPALSPGPDIDAMLKTTFDVMDSSLRRVSRRTNEPVGLFQWTRNEVVLATTTGEYGPANPFLDPEVEESCHEFLHGVPFFASGFFPSVFARMSFKARESLASRFEQYFSENHHLNGGSAVLLSRQAHGVATGLPACDRARGEIGSSMALLNNIVPSVCWLVYHIFSEPAILETCRHQLSQAVEIEADGTRTLDLGRVKSSCPILLSTLNEIYRYYGVAAVLVRQVVEDHMLNKAYLLKKGSLVLMPTSAQHFSQAEWGPDANKFKHERFMDGKGSSDPSKRHHTTGLRVFGGGALLCPGRHLANDVILNFATMMILRLDLRPIHDGPSLAGNHWDALKAENSFGMSIARVLLQPDKEIQVAMAPSRQFSGENGASWRLRLSGSGGHVAGDS